MPFTDDFGRLLEAARSYKRCSGRLIAGFEQLLGELSVSSSLTSKRYPVWSAVRRNMDDAFLESLAGFRGEWSRELLAGCRLSEMGKNAPSVCAIPNGTMDPAYSDAWAELDAGWADQLMENCQSPGLQPEFPRRPLNDGWDFKIAASKRLSKPASVLPIAWQLSNLGSWEKNFRCVLQNLGPRTEENPPDGVSIPYAYPIDRVRVNSNYKSNSNPTTLDLEPLKQLSTGEREKIIALLRDVTDADARSLLAELSKAMARPGHITQSPIQYFHGILQRHRSGDFVPTTPGAKAAAAVALDELKALVARPGT